MSSDASRIEAIVRAVSGIPDATARGDALDSECGNDLELRQKVEAVLLAAMPGAPATKANTNPGDDATVPPRAAPRAAVIIKGTDREQGVLLAGRYRLGKEIARGGMGKVNWATDELFNREVAVKFLLASPKHAPDLAKRFRNEAQVTARLQHPGVPPVHDLGADDNGRPFLVMKLIQGHTLQKHLFDRKSPAEELPRWVHVFEQIARTVGFAHSKNIIHRDLKPLNIMLGVFGEVQVMDWGLAKELGTPELEQPQGGPDALTGPGQVLGTLQYMPPEQARGEIENVDARADVFSLGGSIVAQQGSSGGAVANENGNLVGVVVTSTITADTASRDLKALSFSYIAEDFVKENGMQLVDFLASDLAQKASSFNAGIAPTLTKTLTDILSQP